MKVLTSSPLSSPAARQCLVCDRSSVKCLSAEVMILASVRRALVVYRHTALSAFHVISHLILITTLWGRFCYYSPFPYKATGPEKCRS